MRDPEKKRAYSRAYYLAHRDEMIRRATEKSQEWRAKNPERRRAAERARYAKDPAAQRTRRKRWALKNPGAAAAASRAWRQANPDKARASVDAWNTANPERRSALRDAWVKANPDRWKLLRRVAHQNRRHRLKSGAMPVSSADVANLWESYAGLCVYCLGPAQHLDHVVPLARGGDHCIDNLVPACAHCNISKKDRPLIVWLARRKLTLAKAGTDKVGATR